MTRHKFVYFLIVVVVACGFYLSVRNSGLFTISQASGLEGIKVYFSNLSFKNFMWGLSVPGFIGLLFFKKQTEYVRFFFKIFRLILLVMAAPVALGIFGAIGSDAPWYVSLGIFVLIWILLSLLGAFMMTQKEYIFGDYKKDTAWRNK